MTYLFFKNVITIIVSLFINQKLSIMKKTIIVLFAAVLTLGGASSCKKVRNCTCADGTVLPMGKAKLSD